jgi:hypothetical protein
VAPDPRQTHSVAAPGRKPRRFWLIAPYVALAMLAALWSAGWVWMIGETRTRLDHAAASLRAAGWTVAWAGRHIGGYPFRLDVDFAGLRLADPSGWALAAPTLKTEAFAFAPGNWVFFAPDGLAFTRPDGGAVAVRASALRGSIAGWDQSPPRISLEGDDMVFAAAPGAEPFSLAGAKNLQVYTRAGPQKQAGVFLSLDGGVARPGSWVGQIAGGKPVRVRLDGIISQTDELKGKTWRGLIQHWSDKGGTLDVHQLMLTAGDAGLEADKGSVAVDDNGRLEGVLEASLRDEGRVLAVARTGKAPPAGADSHANALKLRLTLRDGFVWVGPLRLAPAPRLY